MSSKKKTTTTPAKPVEEVKPTATTKPAEEAKPERTKEEKAAFAAENKNKHRTAAAAEFRQLLKAINANADAVVSGIEDGKDVTGAFEKLHESALSFKKAVNRLSVHVPKYLEKVKASRETAAAAAE